MPVDPNPDPYESVVAPVRDLPPVTLTDAAPIVIDASTGTEFRVTLGGSHTLSNPTNPSNGQKIRLVINPVTFTLTFDTKYKFGGAGAPSLTASKDNYLEFVYNLSADEWRCVIRALGF